MMKICDSRRTEFRESQAVVLRATRCLAALCGLFCLSVSYSYAACENPVKVSYRDNLLDRKAEARCEQISQAACQGNSDLVSQVICSSESLRRNDCYLDLALLDSLNRAGDTCIQERINDSYTGWREDMRRACTASKDPAQCIIDAYRNQAGLLIGTPRASGAVYEMSRFEVSALQVRREASRMNAVTPELLKFLNIDASPPQAPQTAPAVPSASAPADLFLARTFKAAPAATESVGITPIAEISGSSESTTADVTSDADTLKAASPAGGTGSTTPTSGIPDRTGATTPGSVSGTNVFLVCVLAFFFVVFGSIARRHFQMRKGFWDFGKDAGLMRQYIFRNGLSGIALDQQGMVCLGESNSWGRVTLEQFPASELVDIEIVETRRSYERVTNQSNKGRRALAGGLTAVAFRRNFLIGAAAGYLMGEKKEKVQTVYAYHYLLRLVRPKLDLPFVDIDFGTDLRSAQEWNQALTFAQGII